MGLTARLNDTPFRATFAKTSDVAKQVMEQGGTKMPPEVMREYVNRYFLPKFKLREKQ